MAYPASFHRLVIIGQLYDDVFNTTISMVPTGGSLPAVTDSLLTAISDVVRIWWPKGAITTGFGGGCSIGGSAILTGIKLNRIGTNGLYQDAIAKESILGTPVAGIGTSGLPPQLSLVASLRGASPRAKAGRGRMYIPPSNGINSGLDTHGKVPDSVVNGHAKGVVTLLQTLNSAYATAGVSAVAGIASKAGVGAFQPVATVAVGHVVDTMRSRRNKDDEAPYEQSM